MIADLMLYDIAIATLLGLAGVAVERIAAWRRWPRRGIWMSALVLSVVYPSTATLVPHMPLHAVAMLAERIQTSALSHDATPSGVRYSIGEPPIEALTPNPPPLVLWPTRALLERIVTPLWIIASVGLVALYACLLLRLRAASRYWRLDRVNGQELRVTQTLGPAVCGFVRPVILMPQWLFESPGSSRTLALIHEQEHIVARDPVLLLLGLLLVAIVPWNPVMWWQLLRLRFAIEVDCDARVLRRGTESRTYGEVLLQIGRRLGRTPIGAIALTEPASQLLRRIRIMRAVRPKRGMAAVGVCLASSLACVAMAARLQGPTLYAVSASTSRSASALLKPPLLDDPRQAVIQNVVRSTYPELFSPSAAPGWVAITLLMNQDGKLYKGYKDATQQDPYITNTLKAFDVMGVDYEHRGDRVQLSMKGGSAGNTGIYVRAFFLKPEPDASRDVSLVRARVNERYRALYKPQSADRLTELFVFMTKSGDIERSKIESVKATSADVVPAPEQFVAMGIPRERIGPVGKAILYEGSYEGALKSERLLVIYAWPRRAGEPPPKPWEAEQPGPAAPNDDPAVDRAIAEKYFPDLYTYTTPRNEPIADFWVLLDHGGKVIATGRRYLASGRDLKLYLESLYPGIRTEGNQPVELKSDHGRPAVVNFMWLAADSPVTDLSKADVPKRSDLSLYAEIRGEGSVSMTSLVVLKFGSRAIAVDDNNNLDLEVSAEDGRDNTVMLRARIQHVSRRLPSEFQFGAQHAVEAAWSAETPPVRVRYGEFSEIQVVDRDNKTWRVALHPERMQGTTQ